MRSKREEQISEPGNLVNQPSVDRLPNKGSRQYCELVTKVKGGEPFIRRTVVHGRPYYQSCQYVYQDGKRKLKVIKHLGTRKPRRGC